MRWCWVTVTHSLSQWRNKRKPSNTTVRFLSSPQTSTSVSVVPVRTEGAVKTKSTVTRVTVQAVTAEITARQVTSPSLSPVSFLHFLFSTLQIYQPVNQSANQPVFPVTQHSINLLQKFRVVLSYKPHPVDTSVNRNQLFNQLFSKSLKQARIQAAPPSIFSLVCPSNHQSIRSQ